MVNQNEKSILGNSVLKLSNFDRCFSLKDSVLELMRRIDHFYFVCEGRTSDMILFIFSFFALFRRTEI